MRNVEFTGPYFHNGSQATLEQVLEFYNRDGDFAGANLGPGIGNINLNAGERTAVAAFLRALSDDRVRFQRAPSITRLSVSRTVTLNWRPGSWRRIRRKPV